MSITGQHHSPNHAPGVSIIGGPSWGLDPDVMGGPDAGPRVSVMGSGDRGTRLQLFGDSGLAFVDSLFTQRTGARDISSGGPR